MRSGFYAVFRFEVSDMWFAVRVCGCGVKAVTEPNGNGVQAMSFGSHEERCPVGSLLKTLERPFDGIPKNFDHTFKGLPKAFKTPFEGLLRAL